MKRPLQKIPVVLTVLALAALLTYGFWPAPVNVEVAVATRGRLQVTVRDDGETRIREKYIVSAPVAGQLQRIEWHAGDAVMQEKTVLARIQPGEPSLLDARTTVEAESRVLAAEALLLQASEALKHRISLRDLAQHEFERASLLRKSNSIAAAEFDLAEHQFEIAAAEVRAAEFAEKIANFELAQARAAFVRVRPDDSTGGETLFVIPSPIDGRVLRVLHEDSGMIATGTPLLEVGNLNDMELKVDLLSTDAVRVRHGARVFIEHWGGNGILEGAVRVVEPSAFLKISALGIEEKRVNVIADFTSPLEQRESLGDGYRVEARIVISEIDNAVKVPAGTIFRDGEQSCVFRIRDGKAEKTTVAVGETSGMETQILSGVAPGDLLILYPTDRVRDGISVEFESQ